MTLLTLGRTVFAIGLPVALFGSLTMTSTAPAQESRFGTSDRMAIINANGTIERDFGLKTSTRLSVGTYDLRWNRNITRCAATATLGSPTSFTVANGTITVVQRSGSSGRGYFIQTRDQANALSDREFMIHVACP
jgi:hypothetical protein